MWSDIEVRLQCIEHARHMLIGGAGSGLGNDAVAIAKSVYAWVTEVEKPGTDVPQDPVISPAPTTPPQQKAGKN